jgi:dTDP-4-amino-4,6-dideoxygalactose transaminase
MADPGARLRGLDGDIETTVLGVLRSGRWVGGPVVAEAEAVAARLFARAGAVGTNSGTDALAMALQAVGVRPGDEVIVPALTFFATAGAVCAIGAVPVVVDVREDACIDPDAARRALGSRTRAIVPVHLYGTRADPCAFGPPVVDDSAQAVGGSPPRSVGLLSAISTYPTKTWSSAGDGGFVVGDDPVLLGRVRSLGHHGAVEAHVHATVDGVVGRNSRLDAVQAAILVAQAGSLEERVSRRRAIAARYDAALPTGIRAIPRDAGSPVHVYAVTSDRREAIRAALAERGVETAVYYPLPLHAQAALASYGPGSCPVAEHIARTVFALPVHENLSDDDVDTVIRALSEVAA